jgi:predicted Zn-dependent peptidase
MKKIFFAAILFTAVNFAAANTDLKTFTVDGIKVILKPTTKEVVSARLFIKGGTSNYAKSSEGIESLLLNMITEGGTTTKNKLVFSAAAEKIGTEFGSSTSYDFSELNMTCIKPFWNESWSLFSDAILNPAFSEEEFQLVQKQLVTASKQKQSSPDEHLRNIAMQHSFEGRNYAKLPEGSPESLQKITLNDLKNHYKKVIGKNHCYLVVVGNVTQEDITQKVKSSLAKLSFGTTVTVEPRKLITEPGIFIEDRDIATNYIRGLMSAPQMSHPDGLVMRMAMSVLRDRFFVELRTKRSLTYAPQASYAYLAITEPYNIIYASTQKPKEALEVMIDEINSVKSKGFLQSELDNEKQSFLTQYYLNLQTAADQSYNLGIAELWGNASIAEQFSEKLMAITLKDLNRVFDKYTNAIRWTYLGKKEQVLKEDFKQTKAVESKYKPY